MVDFGSSVGVLLLCVVILETAVMFGNWINKRALRVTILPMSKNPKNSFYGFNNSDYLDFYLSVFFLSVLALFAVFYLFPLYLELLNRMNGVGVLDSLPYISLTFSFIAITLTLVLTNLNYIRNIFTKVQTRNRDNALHERLDDIEDALRGIGKTSIPVESCKESENNREFTSISVILISIFGMGIFVFFTSLILLSLYPTKSADITIAIFAGVISGGFILLFQKSILER